MGYRVGGYAKTTGRTKGFHKLPANSGDIAPVNMVTVTSDRLLFLAEMKVRTEPSEFNPREENTYVMWRVLMGEMVVWISEEVLRLPRRDEIPEEAWSVCGI